ncbi:MAG: aminotransferase class III-fold pyridoxal phosphate-dependent enzyme [Bacteroidetes bacterium]|nr:aminotransferase class III-fold pyridoxal phosphate-dependent enzyme [Bacteroidota bacterium]
MISNQTMHDEPSSHNVFEVIKQRLDTAGADVMVHMNDTKLPLQALDFWSDALATELYNKGINEGDFVALYLPPGFALCAATMALSKLGANQMLFRDNLKPDFLQQQADSAAFNCLITTLPNAADLFPKIILVDPNTSNDANAVTDSEEMFEGGHFFVEEFNGENGASTKYTTFESSELFVDDKIVEYSDSLLYRLWHSIINNNKVELNKLDMPFWDQQIIEHIQGMDLNFDNEDEDVDLDVEDDAGEIEKQQNSDIDDLIQLKEEISFVENELEDNALLLDNVTDQNTSSINKGEVINLELPFIENITADIENDVMEENIISESAKEDNLSFEINTFALENFEATDNQTFESDNQTVIDHSIENKHNTSNNNTTIMGRQQHLVTELKEILEEASGIEMASADLNASLIELGLDSLFLTQVSITLSKKYQTKITFRQLNEELSSISALATFIDNHLSASVTYSEPAAVTNIEPTPALPAPQQMQMPVQPQATYTPTVNADAGSVEWLITQQMQIMQQQLALLSGMPVQAPQQSMAAPSAPVASPIVETPAAEAKPAAETKTEEPKEEAKPFGAIARIEKNVSTTLNPEQQKWFNDFVKRYVALTQKSKTFTQLHRAHLADPRVVTGFKPYNKEITYQVVVNKSKGPRVWDIDGNEYVDVLNGFGSNMFGHSPQFVVDALTKQLEQGYEVGPQHPLAGELTQLICELTGSDRAALCNTGSEAVLGALRMARTVTGKNLVVAFNNSYHGINDEVIVRGTKKLKSMPASAGIMPGAVENMLILDYGTDEALQIIKQHLHELAAVLVEPVQSRMADFQPKEFITQLRAMTQEADVALIFDEVITGFRYAQGGAQEFYGVKADIATYGKVCGGGMPIGAMAGTKKYMDALDGGMWQYGDASVPEAGVTYFAGTFVRHPFALAAGVASLQHLKTQGPQLQQQLNAKTKGMVEQLNAFCYALDLPIAFTNFASLFKMKYKHEYPFSEFLFHLWRMNGVHVLDGFPCFLTTSHTEADVQFIVDAFKKSVNELIALDLIPHKKATNGQAKTEPVAVTKNVDASKPPVPNARLGKDPQGNPTWFVADPARPGKFMMVQQ